MNEKKNEKEKNTKKKGKQKEMQNDGKARILLPYRRFCYHMS